MPRITIVYDERNIVTCLRMAFEAEEFVVDTFLDPVIALPKVIFEPPHVLLLNGRMPRIHGIEFFKTFRQYSRAKVIFVSASADDIEEHLANLGLPADGYFAAPFSTSKLVAACKHVLRAT